MWFILSCLIVSSLNGKASMRCCLSRGVDCVKSLLRRSIAHRGLTVSGSEGARPIPIPEIVPNAHLETNHDITLIHRGF